MRAFTRLTVQLYAIRDDAGADFATAKLAQHIGNPVRPIPIDASLAATLDLARQRAFIVQWNAAIAGTAR